ncbi:MAG TPA: DinB family protein [Thermomicrobiaceae bacterium]|nr:DinB family protein [Thermomicrobiaceae bacterium]
MPDQNGMPLNAQALRNRVDASWRQLQRALDAPAAALTAAAADGWSVKDHLAHITAWEQALLATLSGESWLDGLGLGDLAQEPGDIDAINALILARRQSQPLATVLAEARATHARVNEALAALTDADLARSNSSFYPAAPEPMRDEPIVGWIVMNTFQHYDDHGQAFRALVG